MNAGLHYAGLACKNPFHGGSRVTVKHSHAYSPCELADHLYRDNIVKPPRKNRPGRNCTVFDELQTFGYREFR
ncbi:MAG: hypothetical protein AAGC70_02960 [Pseudomonadota bacterium]